LSNSKNGSEVFILASPTDQKTTEQKAHSSATTSLGCHYLLTSGNAATSLE